MYIFHNGDSMIATNKFFKSLLAGAFLACAFSQNAAAVDVAGINYKDTVKVAGKDLVLNGAGVRNKPFCCDFTGSTVAAISSCGSRS